MSRPSGKAAKAPRTHARRSPFNSKTLCGREVANLTLAPKPTCFKCACLKTGAKP